MTPKRDKIQKFILKHIDLLDPTGVNSKRYQDLFKEMTDKDFHEYMLNLKKGTEQIYIYMPNMKSNIEFDNLFKACDSLNLPITERVWIEDTATGNRYLTPEKYMILELPVRRVSQYLQHKLSVPDSDKKIDLLSGQVIKPDKSASISLVEMQTLAARDLFFTISELAKYRGGDIHAYAEFRRSLEENGAAQIDLNDNTSKARSTVILNALLAGMHIESNILEPLS